MNRRLTATLTAVLLTGALLTGSTYVSAGQWFGGHRCDHCGAVCLPQPEQQTKKQHCWEVECKHICIPAIKWPWQSCCEPPRPGRVRTVKVLKKVEYECAECGYKWDAVTPCGKP